MKRNWHVLGALASAVVGIGFLAGCDNGGGSAGGTSAVKGNVVSFQTTATAAAVQNMSSNPNMPSRMGGPGGITVSITGPEDMSAVTADDGTFSFTDLPAGAYGIGFEFDGEQVRYRGNSGQEATIMVLSNQTAEVLSIRISGGNVNIGNVRMMTN